MCRAWEQSLSYIELDEEEEEEEEEVDEVEEDDVVDEDLQVGIWFEALNCVILPLVAAV